MAYVVAAIWRAKEGQADTILQVIEKMTPLSRQEPGCLFYQAHRSQTDPNLFFLYEQYVDEAGYEAHMATPHFEQHVKGEAIPNLESRERAFYETLNF
jgi:quinol monooxygenase YgiN